MRLDGIEDRAALITGGGSSVGRVVAEQFRAAGARVHIADVNPEFISETLAQIPGISGTVCDIGDAVQIAALFAGARESLGDIDFLINCVGIAGPHATIEETSSAEWNHSIQVNLTGSFELMRRVIPGMKARRYGAIVNFSTASTKTGLPSRSPYVASKAGLEALTYTAARELGPFGVRCNAIRPGAINNERLNEIVVRNATQRNISPADAEKDLLRFVSMRTKIEPHELATMVMYLCADTGAHITGQFIEVSGNLEWEG
jgi:NAD(P)-dependent dehydrogenase (short-subunit alcohol dehydrogenase family)